MPPKQLRVTRGSSKAEASASNLVPSSKGNPLFVPSATDYIDSDNEDSSTLPKSMGGTQPVNAGLASESEHSEDGETNHGSDDDPVVREYDIFMTSELAQNLYLFQYPVRSRTKPYTKAQNSCPVDARLKSKSGLVEVDVPVNVALNFDQDKGRIWGDALRKSLQAKESGLAGKAMGARRGKKRRVRGEDDDSSEEEEDIMFVDFAEAVKKGRVLSKQTLGSKIQPDEAKYMVGVFRDDQLHLTPINATLQLRPQFHHVDAQLAAERAQNKSLREAEEQEKPAQARAVHLSVAAQMTDTMKAIRIAEDEEWKKLHWIDQDDDEAWDQYELLCLKEPELASRLKCSTSKAEYMDWLSGAMMRKKEGGK